MAPRWKTIAVAAVALMYANPAGADSLSIPLDVPLPGSITPGEFGLPPYLNVVVDDEGATGSVSLALAVANFVPGEYVTKWYLNLEAEFDPSALIFSAPTKLQGTFADPTIQVGADAFEVPGDGRYDIEVTFSDLLADRFGEDEVGVDVVQYTVTGIPALRANSFNQASTAGEHLAAAYVQGIGAANASAWVAAPELPAVALLPLVLAAAAVGRRR